MKLVLSGVGFSALDQGRASKPRSLRVRSRAHHVPALQPVVGGFSDENREMLMVVVEQVIPAPD
ncbi:hypothetical protein [Lacticaseibacillus rhamnosus]|uniref:hypothetical protein n=1 Tax=Lacticaseibacillus rhamnosus TaxID=47715 RepID=UPI001CDC27F8|nr:hypothetical protein [Lacticaseibacillus rhamnosus]